MLTAYNGYSSEVNLSCASAGSVPATCTLSPAQVTPTSSGAAYTLTAGGVAGDYNFYVHAVGTDSNSTKHNAPVALHIVDFYISTPTSSTLTVAQGGTSNATAFQVSAVGSFSGTVNLSCPTGLPTGAACLFSGFQRIRTGRDRKSRKLADRDHDESRRGRALRSAGRPT